MQAPGQFLPQLLIFPIHIRVNVPLILVSAVEASVRGNLDERAGGYTECVVLRTGVANLPNPGVREA